MLVELKPGLLAILGGPRPCRRFCWSTAATSRCRQAALPLRHPLCGVSSNTLHSRAYKCRKARGFHLWLVAPKLLSCARLCAHEPGQAIVPSLAHIFCPHAAPQCRYRDLPSSRRTCDRRARENQDLTFSRRGLIFGLHAHILIQGGKSLTFWHWSSTQTHTRAQRVSSLKDGCVVDAHYRRRPGDFAVVQSCAQPIKDKVLLIATLSTTAGRVCLQASEPAGASVQLRNTVLLCFTSRKPVATVEPPFGQRPSLFVR